MSSANHIGQWVALGTIGLIGIGTLIVGTFYPELIDTVNDSDDVVPMLLPLQPSIDTPQPSIDTLQPSIDTPVQNDEKHKHKRSSKKEDKTTQKKHKRSSKIPPEIEYTPL